MTATQQSDNSPELSCAMLLRMVFIDASKTSPANGGSFGTGLDLVGLQAEVQLTVVAEVYIQRFNEQINELQNAGLVRGDGHRKNQIHPAGRLWTITAAPKKFVS
eukprot:TRINITY_DN70576_c0_g1_i1.p2 TRINITY_DN70576_c0_g1~~TRINITY_DN70576_c0_g1_i1.p2  ORF type:complete len:105 (+),score=11.34 TRINITY_DN70576_c0_g1_i1:241-555(+)